MFGDERVENQFISDKYRAGLIIEKSLLRKISGNYILENLLKNNEKIDECMFNRRESLDLILKYKRYDLLSRVTIRNLLRKKNSKETYLDYILKEYEKNKNINISFVDPFDGIDSLRNIADLYIIYAKHNLEMFLPKLTEEKLALRESNIVLRALTFNKTFLSLLLRNKNNIDVVKQRLLNNDKTKDLDVILSLNGDYENYKASIDMKIDYADKYLENYNASFETTYNLLRQRDKELINELKQVMDGRCEDKAINVVLCSYIEQLYYGDKNAIYIEIRKLINIFKIDKSFTIKMGDGSYFSPFHNLISLDSSSIASLNHELGHMFYHKLTPHEEDPYFDSIIQNIRNNPQTLVKVAALSNTYKSVRSNILHAARDIYRQYKEEEFNNESDEEITKYLQETKDELFEKYRKKGYSKEVLDTILSKSYTLEEYKHQHEVIQNNKLSSVIGEIKVGPIMQIGDIIDAIYNGEFMANKLVDSYGREIPRISGHGLHYYNNRPYIAIDEIFANYCAIRKCTEEDVTYYINENNVPVKGAINCLREIVGNELVDYLEQMYINQVLNSNLYENVRGNKR